MSRVREDSSTPSAIQAVGLEIQNEGDPVAVTEEEAGQHEFSRRILLHATLTAAEFEAGKILPFAGGAAAFQPDDETLQKQDYSKGIVRRITMQSVSSDYDQPVHIAMNLFNGRGAAVGKYTNPSQMHNAVGWLYTMDGAGVSSGKSGGFTNLVSVLPNEVARMQQVVYEPSNPLNQRYIEQFGGFTAESLKAGIVPFKGKDFYYVPHDHIVMGVIRNNWESLGINADLEIKRENEFIKVNTGVVDKVIKELDDHVLKQMPFTNFDKLSVHYSAPASVGIKSDAEFNVVTEFKIDYMFPKVA